MVRVNKAPTMAGWRFCRTVYAHAGHPARRLDHNRWMKAARACAKHFNLDKDHLLVCLARGGIYKRTYIAEDRRPQAEGAGQMRSGMFELCPRVPMRYLLYPRWTGRPYPKRASPTREHQLISPGKFRRVPCAFSRVIFCLLSNPLSKNWMALNDCS